MTDAAFTVVHKRRVDAIVNAVARLYETSPEAILSRDRHKGIAEARLVVYMLTRELTELSLPEIGRALGRDHSSVLSGVRRARVKIIGDHALFERVERVRRAVLADWQETAA